MLPGSFASFSVIVLDIEGTVCPITFVHDVLFPYALKALPQYLDLHWDDAAFVQYRKAFPETYRNDRLAMESHVRDLMAADIKAPYLKALQGLLWEAGYESGDLKAPIFPDVAPFISEAHHAGKKIMIYSSGSVPAQKLFFAHTTAQPSDLSPFISGWFDTVNAGPKREASSYSAILATHPNFEASRWLFLSDNLNEVGAALASGMCSLPVTRPGNAPLPSNNHLSRMAIPDFSPESENKIQESLAALATASKD
ncbi:2,3-diketo-5-methylthio-1-phosphopentane phosphatase [Metarhizium rileyi]|uniref:Enolase-phosphatase E1 n=1 Tax=Metarhizium rileyi (strain RCEF 4871) TaxID=1649241 RepID=A0A166Z2H7_METRR|nr:2,3-diketo-5-methylthio-1-phosphopentane phosphatase [Metarhizium rileyi RCEF 4871]TWU73286.1 enolase-phosphatase E1 [Metarhizium rileyi]